MTPVVLERFAEPLDYPGGVDDRKQPASGDTKIRRAKLDGTSDADVLTVVADAPFAMAATCVLLVCLSCPHAPACASALIAALGAADGWVPLLGMAAGVVFVRTPFGMSELVSTIAELIKSPDRGSDGAASA